MSGTNPPPVIRRGIWRRAGIMPLIIAGLLVVGSWGLYRLVFGSGQVAEAVTTMGEPPAPLQANLPPPPAPSPVQQASVEARFPVTPPDLPPDPAPPPPKDNVSVSVVHFGKAGDAPQAAETHSLRGGVSFKPLEVEGDRAIRVTDLAHTIKPTTRIPLVLDQAIDGNLPGPLVAHLKEDVLGWTADPRRPLIPKGTPVLGQYQSLKVGDHRMMAIAAAAYTTDGRIIPLGGDPFTDDLGRTGIPGKVDSRFWERLGNAVLTDFVLMAVNLPQTALQSQSNGVNFYPENTEGVISQVLGDTSRLPPLFYKTQGGTVMLLTLKPIRVPDPR